MKLDAEGSEWSIIPDLCSRNLLCKNKIEKVYVELHSWVQAPKAWTDSCPTCTKDLKGINEFINNHQYCADAGATQFVELDDESYADDNLEGKVGTGELWG